MLVTTVRKRPGSGDYVATYEGDPNFTGNSGSVPQTVTQADVNVSVSSPGDMVFGQTALFPVSVTAVAPATGIPSGSVTILDFAGAVVGSGDLTSGSADISVTTQNVGPGDFIAEYLGDGNFSSNSGSVPQNVDQAAVSVSISSPGNLVFGQTAAFPVSVTAASPASGTPSGYVTILDQNGVVVGSGELTAGSVGVSVTTTNIGSGDFVAEYEGDTNFVSNSGSVSQTVNPATVDVEISSPGNLVYGQTATFPVTVTAASPGAGTPTGHVTIVDQTGAPIGGGDLTSGSVNITGIVLNVGSGPFVATYEGDSNFTINTGSVDQNVYQAGTTTTIESPGYMTYGQTADFSVSVAAIIGQQVPTGSVTIFDFAGTPVGTGSLDSSGDAVVSVTALNAGSGDYTASYSGDANYSNSSGAVEETVLPAPLTITVDYGQGKVYGTADQALTYSITWGSLVGNDTLTGSLSRAAGEDVGVYAINQGGLTAGPNYTITFNADNFNITPASLTVTTDSGQGKTYGSDDPALTYTVAGSLYFGDTWSGSLTREAGENVGVYAISLGSLTPSSGSNYTITFNADNFNITPAALTVTADSGQGKTYGSDDPALTYTVAGSLYFGDTWSGSLTRESGENVGVYAISLGSLTPRLRSSEYTITFNARLNFNITPAALTMRRQTAKDQGLWDRRPVVADLRRQRPSQRRHAEHLHRQPGARPWRGCQHLRHHAGHSRRHGELHTHVYAGGDLRDHAGRDDNHAADLGQPGGLR